MGWDSGTLLRNSWITNDSHCFRTRMTTPTFRALCAELADELEDWIEGYLINDPADEHTAAAQAMVDRARTLLAASEVVEAGGDSDVIRALVKAEAALADIGDAEREPGDDLAWCERRAAETLPVVREALAFCSTAHPAPNHEAWNEFLQELQGLQDRAQAEGIGPRCDMVEWAQMLSTSPPAPEMGDRERLRIMAAGIRYGYMAGHNDTVEGRYGDPDDVAADYAPEILGELGPTTPPAPSEREVSEWINGLPVWHGATRDELTGIVLRAFARWGRPTARSIPVGERLPGVEDCLVQNTGPDGEPEWWCWFYRPGLEGTAEWRWNTTERLPEWYGWQGVTYWRPYWALPLPGVEA